MRKKSRPSRSLSEKEQQTLLRLIPRCVSPLPENIFYCVSRTFPMVAIEAALWRRGKHGGIEILLTRRPPKDPFWPNLWHIPGTIMRNRERLTHAFRRSMGEVGLVPKPLPQFVTMLNLRAVRRGHVVDLIFARRMRSEERPHDGTFFDTTRLPRDVIPEHRRVIRAVKRYVGI